MNRVIGFIIVAVVLLGAGFYLLGRDGARETALENEDAVSQGRVVFSVTDAAADMGAVSEVNMEIRSVELHSNASGWALITADAHDYNLLDLKANNRSDILAELQVPAGTYDQVRIHLGDVEVETKAGSTKQAVVPKSEVLLNTNLVVRANETSSVNFDFLADKSLHSTENGEYVFAPVVKTETKSNADVTVNGDDSVAIVGGTIDSSATAGMNLDGVVNANFELSATEKINADVFNRLKNSINADADTSGGAGIDTNVDVDGVLKN